jgi:hypothetical protein
MQRTDGRITPHVLEESRTIHSKNRNAGLTKERLADKLYLTHLARVETRKVGNHEMSDRQRNAMQGVDFIP